MAQVLWIADRVDRDDAITGNLERDGLDTVVGAYYETGASH